MSFSEDPNRWGYHLVSEENGKEVWEITEDRLTEEFLEAERRGQSDRDRWLISEMDDYMRASGLALEQLPEDYQQEYMNCVFRETVNLTEQL